MESNSNNLIIDLAPVLTSPEARVAKRFMPRPLAHLGDVVLSGVPSGAITTISLLMIGNLKWLKAAVENCRELLFPTRCASFGRGRLLFGGGDLFTVCIDLLPVGCQKVDLRTCVSQFSLLRMSFECCGGFSYSGRGVPSRVRDSDKIGERTGIQNTSIPSRM